MLIAWTGQSSEHNRRSSEVCKDRNCLKSYAATKIRQNQAYLKSMTRPKKLVGRVRRDRLNAEARTFPEWIRNFRFSLIPRLLSTFYFELFPPLLLHSHFVPAKVFQNLASFISETICKIVLQQIVNSFQLVKYYYFNIQVVQMQIISV